MPDDLAWPRRVIVGAIVVIVAAKKKDRPKAVLQSNAPGQNSFGIKLCPAQANRKLTTMQGRAAHN
jgi:hypothetical protein